MPPKGNKKPKTEAEIIEELDEKLRQAELDVTALKDQLELRRSLLRRAQSKALKSEELKKEAERALEREKADTLEISTMITQHCLTVERMLTNANDNLREERESLKQNLQVVKQELQEVKQAAKAALAQRDQQIHELEQTMSLLDRGYTIIINNIFSHLNEKIKEKELIWNNNMEEFFGEHKNVIQRSGFFPFRI